MRTFERLFIEANKWVLILMLGAMAVVVFANVSLRYLTNFSITWSEEVARYLMIWVTFLGAGLALRYGNHVAIANVQEMAPTPMQRLLRGVIVFLLLAFFAIMVWMGYDYMSRTRFQLTPATRIPFSYVYAAMPIGFVLLIVHLLLLARGYVLDSRFETLDPDTSQAMADTTEENGGAASWR
ncbi:TRAP transporter small permease [Mesorhizobium xinjiangense]|uniref:TRAP transporter small permease n=1 Tax=Mesorhizobium xinjiangense TaxID=2678685 RepID=UPI0018DDD04F|nr:TRAP transporter small permease [Mesorhizobium xinjiangense]